MSAIVQTPLRLRSELATKVRMIAAANNLPLNTYITNVLTEHVQQWEKLYGELPTLPPKEQ
jgi:hypothetical protein